MIVCQAKKHTSLKNATIWTNEASGILKKCNLTHPRWKDQKQLTNLFQSIPNDATIIDAEGKHVTCGIIDEHSHVAISKGVNESGQNNSAEVSIGDVVRSNDINVYRQLSGGVYRLSIITRISKSSWWTVCFN